MKSKFKIFILATAMLILLSLFVSCACGHEHIWDEGRVTREPTSEREGLRLYTCLECDKVKTEPVEKLPHTEHTWDNGEIIVEATKEKQGEKLYTCILCNHTKTGKYSYTPSKTVTDVQFKNAFKLENVTVEIKMYNKEELIIDAIYQIAEGNWYRYEKKGPMANSKLYLSKSDGVWTQVTLCEGEEPVTESKPKGYDPLKDGELGFFDSISKMYLGFEYQRETGLYLYTDNGANTSLYFEDGALVRCVILREGGRDEYIFTSHNTTVPEEY